MLAILPGLLRSRHGICVAKMLDNVGLRYPHRASGAKAPRTLRPLPLLRFAVSATGGAHLCSIQYYLRFWLSICRTSLAVSALRVSYDGFDETEQTEFPTMLEETQRLKPTSRPTVVVTSGQPTAAL